MDGSAAAARKRRVSDSPHGEHDGNTYHPFCVPANPCHGFLDKQHPPQPRRVEARPAQEPDDNDTLQRVASTLSVRLEGIIDERTADKLFDRYVVEMAVHMPAVIFPRQTTAHQIRATKPILFLSILVAAAVGMMPIEPQEEMTELLKATFAQCIIRLGGKSIELIQALIIAVAWYRPPKLYEQMNFYQLTHIAAVMAIDIGLGKRIPGWKTGRPQSSADQARMPKYLLHSGTIEARRTWLGCYFLCSK